MSRAAVGGGAPLHLNLASPGRVSEVQSTVAKLYFPIKRNKLHK